MASAPDDGADTDTDTDGDPASDTGAGADRLALTASGRRAAIAGTVELPEHHGPRVSQRNNLSAIYGALVRRVGPLTRRDLRPYFTPAPSSERNQGFYADFGRWWSSIGVDQLCSLPGVRDVGDGDGGETQLRFDGVDPSADVLDELELEADDTRPLAEFRRDPRVKAKNALDDRHGPGSDAANNLLVLWDAIASAGTGGATAEEIERDYSLPSLDDYADQLAELPHIERDVDDVRPEDIKLDDLDTLAELRSAEEQIQAPPTTTWRFAPPGSSG